MNSDSAISKRLQVLSLKDNSSEEIKEWLNNLENNKLTNIPNKRSSKSKKYINEQDKELKNLK